ncbi:putative membrane protein [Acetivibrio thermocellus BC1]|nr:putative membrane protein [Acetivibrio thermocellus BC1]
MVSIPHRYDKNWSIIWLSSKDWGMFQFLIGTIKTPIELAKLLLYILTLYKTKINNQNKKTLSRDL